MTLYHGASGRPIFDVARHRQDAVERDPYRSSSGQTFVVRLVKGCQHGVHYMIRPAGLLTVMKKAHAKDGGVAALAVIPRKPGTSTITVGSGKETVGFFVLDLYA